MTMPVCVAVIIHAVRLADALLTPFAEVEKQRRLDRGEHTFPAVALLQGMRQAPWMAWRQHARGLPCLLLAFARKLLVTLTPYTDGES